MSRIRIYGDTSGHIDIKAPDEAGNTEVVIPEGGFAGLDSPTFTGNVDLPVTTDYNGEQLSTTLASKVDVTNNYTFRTVTNYTSSGTFTKATYPWLRALVVRVVGAGGGGGGCATTAAGQVAIGAGGAAGGYAETFLLASALSASETVTIGAGGSGGAAGDNDGAAGGTSSFGSFVSASGGGKGDGGPAGTLAGQLPGLPNAGGTGASGNITNVRAGSGFSGFGLTTTRVVPGRGADSVFGGAERAGISVTAAGANAGFNAYGAGGGGAGNAASRTQQAGGDGADGLILLELYS